MAEHPHCFPVVSRLSASLNVVAVSTLTKRPANLFIRKSGRVYKDKQGKEHKAETEVSLISVTDDARTLMSSKSGTAQEVLYANISNSLKDPGQQGSQGICQHEGNPA